MTNCPPVYRNIQCESFGNKRKITSQMLRQFCKNDAYLYEQIMALWDATDPESRKRFYPPDFMDVAHSFGIESHILADYEAEEYNYWNTVYRFNRTGRWEYHFDFNGSNDKLVEYDTNGVRLHDGDMQYVIVYADSYLDVENNHNEQMLEIVNENGVTTLRPPLSTDSYNQIIHHNEEYDTKSGNTGSKYVVKQKEKLGKAKKDASYKGAFNNWNCNNHWYNGFDRTKNYNIKSKWRSDPYSEGIPSVCHAQTFKAENSGRISKVNLNVQGTKGAVSPCIVEIRETTKKGYPSKNVLARTEKKFSGSGENIVAFEFKNKALVTKGKTYAIVIRSPLSTFAKCYRIGGWTTGCFSSEKKYYGNGSAFTSTDNGYTWVKNGKTKDTKSYGAHYYDWGINQKPIDFAFEVFVQPIVQKEIKEKVPTVNVEKLIKDGYVLQKNGAYKKVLKEAYDETNTYEFTYIKEGSYYLHLKPIQINPIEEINISNVFTDNSTFSSYWSWEYYSPLNGAWMRVPNNGRVNFNNNETNYTVLKLRIRCDVEKNTYVGGLGSLDTNGTLYNLITTTSKLISAPLTYMKTASLIIDTKLPTRAYLRTLYYHPPQDEILGANIWSEIGVKAKVKNYASVEIDVVHEKTATEHFKFYDLNILYGVDMNNLTPQQEELIEIMNAHINNFNKTTGASYSADAIIDFVYDDYVDNGGLFIEYLMNLLTPVYILPLYYDNATKPTVFFDKIQLPHLPSYPVNGCEIGDDDIIIDTSRMTGLSDYGFYYPLDKSIKDTLSSIDVTYTTKLDVVAGFDGYDSSDDGDIVDENGFEINDVDFEERIEETLTGIFLDKTLDECWDSSERISNDVFPLDVTWDGNQYSSIDYAITKDGNYVIFSRKSRVIQKLFSDLPNSYQIAPASLAGDTSVSNFELKINLTTKSYQEFVDFEVDYDDGTIDFYNQTNLIHGDFNITYNPLWVRGLSPEDFPLKLDLWKEHYRVGTSDGALGIYKMKYNVNTGNYENDVFHEKTIINPYTRSIDSQGRTFYTFKTTVAPRDNIRKLVINEGMDDERALVEDSQFFVDYLANRVVLYISNLNENDTLTIHYTPNLNDDGLALAYRLKRNRYTEQNGEFVEQEEDNYVAQPLNNDDVYIGMNYFTYRT